MVFLIVWLIVQLVLILLTLAYAFLGTYESNHASNIWSVIWGKGLGLFLLGADIIAFISGVIGILSHKDNTAQAVVSGILLFTILPSIISLLLAVGTHF